MQLESIIRVDLDDTADDVGAVETITVRATAHWVVEHEPVSGAYLLIDATGAWCADLQWKHDGECWAQFEPYVAFSGSTTIADVERFAELAELLRGLACPPGRAAKNPR